MEFVDLVSSLCQLSSGSVCLAASVRFCAFDQILLCGKNKFLLGDISAKQKFWGNQNFAEMFILPLSITIVKNVWRFFYLTAVNMRKTTISYKKKDYFSSFSREILKIQASNFTEMFIGLLSTTYLWRFFDLTAVNMRKKRFKHFFLP